MPSLIFTKEEGELILVLTPPLLLLMDFNIYRYLDLSIIYRGLITLEALVRFAIL
jgi:hypothetical protein